MVLCRWIVVHRLPVFEETHLLCFVSGDAVLVCLRGGHGKWWQQRWGTAVVPDEPCPSLGCLRQASLLLSQLGAAVGELGSLDSEWRLTLRGGTRHRA